MSSCSFDSFVSLWKCPANLSVYQAVRSLEFLMESGRPGTQIEGARRHSFHESHLCGRDMPGQIQRTFRNFVRTIVAFVQGNRFDNALRDALFVLEPREVNTMKQKISLFGLDLLHGYRIAQRRRYKMASVQCAVAKIIEARCLSPDTPRLWESCAAGMGCPGRQGSPAYRYAKASRDLEKVSRAAARSGLMTEHCGLNTDLRLS